MRSVPLKRELSLVDWESLIKEVRAKVETDSNGVDVSLHELVFRTIGACGMLISVSHNTSCHLIPSHLSLAVPCRPRQRVIPPCVFCSRRHVLTSLHRTHDSSSTRE